MQASEAVSRKVSDLLDQADPIEGSYTFEVSSAGAERPLKRPSDFERFLGSPVLVKTYKPKDGRKEFAGVLAGYDNGAVLLDMGGAGRSLCGSRSRSWPWSVCVWNSDDTV